MSTQPAITARGAEFPPPRVRKDGTRVLLALDSDNGPSYKSLVSFNVGSDGSIMVFPKKVRDQEEWVYGTVYPEKIEEVEEDLLRVSEDLKLNYHPSGVLNLSRSNSGIETRRAQGQRLELLDGEQIFSLLVNQAQGLLDVKDEDRRKSDILIFVTHWPAVLGVSFYLIDTKHEPAWQSQVPSETGAVLPVPAYPHAFLVDVRAHLPNKYLLVVANMSYELHKSEAAHLPSVSLAVPNLQLDGELNKLGTAAMWTAGIGKVNVNVPDAPYDRLRTDLFESSQKVALGMMGTKTLAFSEIGFAEPKVFVPVQI